MVSCVSLQQQSKMIVLVVLMSLLLFVLIQNHGCNLVNSLWSTNPAEKATVHINGAKVLMEVDTGSGFSICSEAFCRDVLKLKLLDSSVKLKTITSSVEIVGEALVVVELIGRPSQTLKLIVVNSPIDFTPLLGRDWLDQLVPQWRQYFSVLSSSFTLSNAVDNVLESFAKAYPHVFSDNAMSFIKNFEAHITLKENVSPVFLRPYSVPYAMVNKVNAKLTAMINAKEVILVSFSKWASPVFPIPKRDGSIRLITDYKRTVNKCIKTDVYPIPNPEDIFASLAGGKCFCVIDLVDAYTQLRLDKASQEILTMHTSKGLFQPLRMRFGVSSAPAIFQQVMDQILHGIANVKCYLDDILVKGSSYDDCFKTVVLVLERLESYHVRINVKKSLWFANSVPYLGYVISEFGRSPKPAKVEAILLAKVPGNSKEANSFMGLVNFYAPLIPNLSTVAAPIRKAASAPSFLWSEECSNSFQQCKSLLASSDLLVHYDPSLPIYLFTDASPVGVGAMLAHQLSVNGKLVERPVMFASSALNETQQRYSQIDREALAIMFAIARFHKYLWGRHFVIVTDNQPLRHILNPDKGLPILAATRLQHWAAILSGYDFAIEHRKSELLCPVDALSRLPYANHIVDFSMPNTFVGVPLAVSDISFESSKDVILSKVLDITRIGWPSHCSDVSILPYFKLRHELSIEQNCLLYGNRVVIPLVLRAQVLKLLHEGHPGIVRTKLLARNLFWWPSMNVDIETLCENCVPCSTINAKRQHVFAPWPKCTFPFERVHLDYCELGKAKFLIICDAFSKWIDVKLVQTHSSEELITLLYNVFAVFGLPQTLVTDNERSFVSELFKEFCTKYNIALLHSPEYHAPSNGQAERAVETCKAVLKKLALDSCVMSIDERIFRFLWTYRNTPSSTTLKAPNQILFAFQPRTLLTQLLPRNVRPLSGKSSFSPGDAVVLTINKQKMNGVVVKQLNVNQFLVDVQGVLKKPHVNQMSLRL